jgi:polyisoprenoid-binding protein YceI/polyhydroxyalkanoate synthesis regulator phasin
MLGGVKRLLALFGLVALCAWTVLGLVAWNESREALAVLSEQNQANERAGELAALEERLDTLHEDVRALAMAMGSNLDAVSSDLATSQEEHTAVLTQRIDALRAEVAALREARPTLPATEAAPATEVAHEAPAPEPPAAASEPAAAPAKARKSFLAFTLPSDDFRFDERRSWTILPALSRVGFDAKTTLHDFTATSSSVEGELEADLAHPDTSPRAKVTVQAATLGSGEDARDAEMRDHLAVQQHPTLVFELTSFVAGTVDSAAMRASGTAHGRMTIRGVTQDVVMPLELAIDDARRLTVEGQMKLDLERFQVPVPNKLGLITMEKEVQVWISLRLRVNPRSNG